MPSRQSADVVGRQLLRSGLSVGANYRAARRARSRKEFIAKLGVVVEEIDESAHWLEVIIENDLMKHDLVRPLFEEAMELTKIFAATRRRAKDNQYG